MTPTCYARRRVLVFIALLFLCHPHFFLPFALRAQPVAPTPSPAPTYDETFRDLHRVLGERYGAFDLKPEIDWSAVGHELIPRAAAATTDDEFGLVCLELVARLEDSHAALMPGSRRLPEPPGMAAWEAGFACLEDDRGQAVVFHVEPGSPAARARLKPGLAIVSINDEPTTALIARTDDHLRRWVSYSSPRYRRYHAYHFFHRATTRHAPQTILARRPDGLEVGFRVAATMEPIYQPRVPVPIEGINESSDVSAALLPGGIGYLQVRRMRDSLDADLDRAAQLLIGARALVIDVRGNSGGGFDRSTSHRVFDCDNAASGGLRLCKPTAVLIDERCISAGEGWVSWFRNKPEVRFFGQTTAGASSAKDDYTLLNGFYKVRIPVRPRRGFLDRPIERRGIEPDVLVRATAADLAAGRDTVLEAAKAWLEEQATNGPRLSP